MNNCLIIQIDNYLIIEFPSILGINCDDFIIGDRWHNKQWYTIVIMRYKWINDPLSQIHSIALNYIFIDMTDFI